MDDGSWSLLGLRAAGEVSLSPSLPLSLSPSLPLSFSSFVPFSLSPCLFLFPSSVRCSQELAAVPLCAVSLHQARASMLASTLKFHLHQHASVCTHTQLLNWAAAGDGAQQAKRQKQEGARRGSIPCDGSGSPPNAGVRVWATLPPARSGFFVHAIHAALVQRTRMRTRMARVLQRR